VRGRRANFPAGVTLLDTVQNGWETDIDCGGAACLTLGRRCADGQGCATDADCTSSVCWSGVCTSCSNGLQDGGESDVRGHNANLGVSYCLNCCWLLWPAHWNHTRAARFRRWTAAAPVRRVLTPACATRTAIACPTNVSPTPAAGTSGDVPAASMASWTGASPRLIVEHSAPQSVPLANSATGTPTAAQAHAEPTPGVSCTQRHPRRAPTV
jgi:hypothetical protein